MPPLISQTLSLWKNTSIATVIGTAELMYQSQRVEDGELSRRGNLCGNHRGLSRRVAADHRRGGLVPATLSGARIVTELLTNYWLYFLVGQFPDGPLGGLALTILLGGSALLLALRWAVLLGVARVSHCAGCVGR